MNRFYLNSTNLILSMSSLPDIVTFHVISTSPFIFRTITIVVEQRKKIICKQQHAKTQF